MVGDRGCIGIAGFRRRGFRLLLEEKRLSVYSGTASYSLTVREQNGAEYVGLLEILEPLGPASARTDGGAWKLSFNRVDGEFTPGQTRARVRGKEFRSSRRTSGWKTGMAWCP